MVTPSTFKMLPPLLQILEIKSSIKRARAELSASDFQYLPRGLLRLTLTIVSIASETSDEWHHLPQTLKALVLGRALDYKLFYRLPPTIEDLEVSCWSPDLKRHQLPVSLLPRTLRRITASLVSFELDTALPPNLEMFETGIAILPNSTDKPSIWPRTMTALPPTLVTTKILSHWFSEHFSKLKRLTLSYDVLTPINQGVMPGDFLDVPLPKTLEELSLADLNDDIFLKLRLPDTLRTLRYHPHSAAALRNLPSHLETLEVLSLILHGVSQFGPEEWSHLPLGITRLTVVQVMLGVPESLSSFHRLKSLRFLSLTRCSSDWLSHTDMSSFWPRSMESLLVSGVLMNHCDWFGSL
jgi:hypothetical protein